MCRCKSEAQGRQEHDVSLVWLGAWQLKIDSTEIARITQHETHRHASSQVIIEISRRHLCRHLELGVLDQRCVWYLANQFGFKELGAKR